MILHQVVSCKKKGTSSSGNSTTSASAFMEQWKSVGDFSEEGIAVVELKSTSNRSLFGYITKAEKILVDPIYSNAYGFQNGYASVCLDGKWGFINSTGRYAIQPQYSKCYYYVSDSGSALVKTDEVYQMITMTGKVLVDKISDIGLAKVDEALPKYVSVKVDEKWQIFDLIGNRYF